MPKVILQNVHHNGHTYLLIDQGSAFTWAGAEAHAASLGGHLVTLNDVNEQDFVYSTFSEVGFVVANDRGGAVWFFLGLNDVDAEGTFEWVSGETSAYTNWYAGQPASSLANQDYGAYFFFPGFDPAGQWFAIPDDDPNNYTLALIELPSLLGTGGNNKIKGGIGADLLSGLGGDDALYGYDGKDKLEGGKGDDVLFGGAGEDIMIGGAGDDTYDVDDISGTDVDKIIERANQGIDTVVLSDDFFYTLPTNIENFIAKGENFSTVTGNGLANVMSGSTGTDKLDARDGDDRLFGNGGDDDLEGGAGDDEITGGEGRDFLFGDTGKDILIGGAGADDYVTWGARDTIVINSVADIGKGLTATDRERIAKFDSGDHVVDLSAIDANGSLAANGAFDFIGQKQFSDKAGQLRYEVFDVAGTIGDYILLEGDINGDGSADFRFQMDNFLRLIDSVRLRESDFVL